MAAHGIMFHHFHGGRFAPSQGSMDAQELADLIEYTKRQWRLLPAAEWYEAAVSGRLGERDVCLTFDDNLRCQYDVALPVLDHYGVPAFWFVHTQPVVGGVDTLEAFRHFRHEYFPSMDGFFEAFFARITAVDARMGAILASDQARDYCNEFSFYTLNDRRFRYVRDMVLGTEAYTGHMFAMMAERSIDLAALDLWMGGGEMRDLAAKGHMVGLHSHTHPTRIDLLPAEQQRGEYAENRRVITESTGIAPSAMSHPCGCHTPELFAILEDLGIRLGFRGDMGEPNTPCLDHRRLEHTDALARMRD